MATQKKTDIVNELTEKVKKSKSIVFAEYKGIKHKQLEELRRALRKVDAEIVVSKNRLLLRALGEQGEGVKDTLQNDTAALFSYGDEVTGVKELAKFFKAATLGKTKGGILEGKALSEADVNKLAALPSKQILLGQLVGQMIAPLYGLHHSLSWNINRLVWGLNAVKEKKQN
jgi:large subunit ribosomal protein L10